MPIEPPIVSSEDLSLARRTPERLIGGFSRRDSTLLFYSLIRSVLALEDHVLDLGAGRGAQVDSQWPFRRDLVTLRRKVARVVGIDVDEAVLQNPLLDEAHVFTPGGPLPFADASFDVIVSDWVLEHVDDPASFAAEIHRVLKPDGWFFARTPNRFGLIALGATLVPNRLHTALLSKLQPDRQSQDVFPTRYRMNTVGAIRQWFPKAHWDNYSTTIDSEFMYVARFPLLFEIVERLGRLLPSALRPILIVATRKR
jgi:SAM-dependent methyltransferase